MTITCSMRLLGHSIAMIRRTSTTTPTTPSPSPSAPLPTRPAPPRPAPPHPTPSHPIPSHPTHTRTHAPPPPRLVWWWPHLSSIMAVVRAVLFCWCGYILRCLSFRCRQAQDAHFHVVNEFFLCFWWFWLHLLCRDLLHRDHDVTALLGSIGTCTCVRAVWSSSCLFSGDGFSDVLAAYGSFVLRFWCGSGMCMDGVGIFLLALSSLLLSSGPRSSASWSA